MLTSVPVLDLDISSTVHHVRDVTHKTESK